MFAFLLGKCLGMRLLSHIVFVLKFLRNFLWLYYFVFSATPVSPLSSVCFIVIIIIIIINNNNYYYTLSTGCCSGISLKLSFAFS